METVEVALALSIELHGPNVYSAGRPFQDCPFIRGKKLLSIRPSLLVGESAVEVLRILRSIWPAVVVTQVQTVGGLTENPGAGAVLLNPKLHTHFISFAAVDNHEQIRPRERMVVPEIHQGAASLVGIAAQGPVFRQETSLSTLAGKAGATGEKKGGEGQCDEANKVHGRAWNGPSVRWKQAPVEAKPFP